ncbi:unnamed protein product [Bathycoccus prasinos]
MRKIFFFLLPLIFSLQSPPKVFAVVQKWPVKLHSNSSVSLEGGESNNILFDSDVTTIYNKLTVYADADFDFSTEFELAAKSLEELEVDVFEHEASQPSPPPPPLPSPPPSPSPPPPSLSPPPPPGYSLVLSVGGKHVCAILNGGCVKCFGHNSYGQLGYGNTEWSEWNDLGDNLPALDLGIGHTAKAISTAWGISCAILNDDTVKCWGNNDNGMLALGEKGWNTRRGDDANEMGDNLPAVDLGTGRTAKAISCGSYSICAILDDDSVKCWGAGSTLGLGETTSRGDDANEMGDNLPAVNLGTGRTAKAISVGSGSTCAILDDDSLKCWGNGYRGSLGQGDRENRGDDANEMGDNLPTVDLGTGRTATSVSVGGGFTCALLDNSSVKCWGWNEYDNLGLGDRENRGDDANEMGDNLPAVNLGTGRTAKAISVGTSHTCAILDDGTVKCFGYNALGHLGLGDTEGRGNSASDMGDNLPTVDLGTGRTALTISTGNGKTCALLDDESVKCWGQGIGDSANEMGDNLPVQKFGTCA